MRKVREGGDWEWGENKVFTMQNAGEEEEKEDEEKGATFIKQPEEIV